VNAGKAVSAARASGAKLNAAGTSLVLEADTPPSPTVVEALRVHKPEVLDLLRGESKRRRIVEWLNAHPVSSDPDRCCSCGGSDRSGDVLLPFGVASTGHAWLHSECWFPWHKRREADAMRALSI
jgi:hypothetical protein